jgi:CMP/dCMP kinase
VIIAVDGPAASGKGTIARALAAHYRLPHLDTGLLYRAVALNLLQVGGDPDSEFAATRACDISRIDFADPELKSETVGGVASRISAYPMVREQLLERQRSFAEQPGGAVLDGRDIAAPEVRARRRCEEMQARGLNVHYADVLADIRARDERDSGRAAAPLRMAYDADLLDTSELTIDAAVQRALALVEARIRRSA